MRSFAILSRTFPAWSTRVTWTPAPSPSRLANAGRNDRRAAPVEDRSGSRRRKCDEARPGKAAEHNLIDNRHDVTAQRQPLGIEPLREQAAFPSEQQISVRPVDGCGVRIEKMPRRRSVDLTDVDASLLPARGIEKEMTAIRERVREAVCPVRQQRGQGHRLAALGGDTHQRRIAVRRKDDGPVRVPGTAEEQRGIGHLSDGAALEVNPFELATRPKADRPAVGRPEWILSTVGALEQLR